MKSQDRREFLRECFDYVTPSELQDALQERDEANDDKRYQALVDDLHEMLQLQPQDESGEARQELSPSIALFHSEEARIGKRVHELIELVEDLAVEVSFFEPKHAALFPEPLLERLRRYECPVKRLKKEHDVLKRRPQPDSDDNPQCECVCGRHRLVDDVSNQPVPVPEVPAIAAPREEDPTAPKPRRRSTKRPLSARSGRKNAISFGSRFGSPRKSSAMLHVFPLAEVCHLVSSILHLQFSRDAAEATPSVGNEAVSMLSFDERWSFLKRDAPSRTFKTLAKDFLVRKYGIKSIAVMHTLQLERSLLHYSAKDNNVRCELFSWFFGADKARAQSKDFAFAFFQRLVKCLLSLFAAKKRSSSISSPVATVQSLAYSTLISMYTEFIGDGDPSSLRALPASLALEACKLCFPPAMQRSSHFTLFREKLYRSGLEQKAMDLEEFFRGVMTAWQLTVDAQMQDAAKTMEAAGVLDIDGFAKCLALNGLEFTTGERYELFDMLTQEDDADTIPSKSMLHFLMEARYLSPNAT